MYNGNGLSVVGIMMVALKGLPLSMLYGGGGSGGTFVFTFISLPTILGNGNNHGKVMIHPPSMANRHVAAIVLLYIAARQDMI